MAQAQLTLHRTCWGCKGNIYGTAAELREHAKLCQMAARLGLVLPGIVTPDEAARQAKMMRGRGRRTMGGR